MRLGFYFILSFFTLFSMYNNNNNNNNKENSSLAIVSSVLFPHHTEGSLLEKRRANLQCLPGAWIEDKEIITTSVSASDADIDLLKRTIASLRKEKQKLEETNDIVKKSIQIVARKRLIAQSKKSRYDSDSSTEDEDIYIVVPSDFIPTEDEMKAAGLDGWEWVSSI